MWEKVVDTFILFFQWLMMAFAVGIVIIGFIYVIMVFYVLICGLCM